MNSFKKVIFMIGLVVICLLNFSILSSASESISSQVKIQKQSPIYGLEGTIRDCKELNIRKSPNSNAKALTTITSGESFTILDQIGKWFYISYHDITGYVFWKYVQFIEPEIRQNSKSSLLLGNSIIHYTSSENRDTNIGIACATINKTILKPNEKFYWSKIVGQTTAKKGYQEAPVIINRKTVPGLGGGVCQVSTTLYNAILDTTIKPDEVHSHSISSAYSKNDATVAHGSKDFIFTNPYNFSIQIEIYSYKSVIFCNLYKVETTNNKSKKSSNSGFFTFVIG